MAYAAVVSFAQTVDLILNHGDYSISPVEKQQFVDCQRCAISLREFLDNFPEKAQKLEERIRDVAYEAEDTVELLRWEQFRSKPGYHFPYLGNLTKIIERIGEQGMDKFRGRRRGRRYRVPDLDNLTKKIESITEHVSTFTIKNEQHPVDSPSATSSSKITSTVMIGLDDDLIAIKARLRGESSRLQVIPIVGMGGIGKTTLARNAFDDPLIMEYFHIRVWVTVSQDYCAQEILSGILLSIQEFNKEKSAQRNELVEVKVHKSLKGRRYLIVMDDMWCEKAWDVLKQVFPDDGNGSRIVLTSRLSLVAAYPDPCTPLYEMRLMNADQSWDLLRHKLFAHQDCPPELENIGKKIASSCRGLPLAIVVIAGILSMVGKTPTSWGKIADNVNSTIATKDGPLEKILSLSYNNLPHHLRPCFLYMGGFPEDYEIRVSKLVKIWVAEGFLRRKNVSKCLEEEAEEYLEDLVNRSLIFVSKRKSNGKVKSCSVHDLVRELCIRKAQEEKFLLRAEKILPENKENQRRLSVSHSKEDCLADTNDLTVRTIKCFHCKGNEAGSLGKYKLLRVLIAEYTKFWDVDYINFADQASELLHLRYLDLFHNNHIPRAISNLQNLQTLMIHAWKTSRYYPSHKVDLPSEIWRMPQLRHLVSYFFGSFPCPPEDDDLALENLQTLSLVTNFECTERVLQKIPNLKKLGIFYYRYGSDVEYQLENLAHLHQLEKLKIKIYADFPDREKLNPVFPLSLKKLTLSGRRLPWEGITIVASLPNLEVLKLRDFACKGSTWETNEDEFPQLKYLLIDKSDLQHWITESSHFPTLKSLLLRRCWCLTAIPDDIGEIPTLELIEVDNGNKSLVESAKRILEEQQSWGNEGLQVRWVQS
ncbi:hypothetical protein ACS0TY_023756 [Phlomoides rotata]